MSKRRRRQHNATQPPSALPRPARAADEVARFGGFDLLPVTQPSGAAAPNSAFDPLPSLTEITKPTPQLSRLVDAWPHLAIREAVLAIAVSALAIAMAFIVDAPLAGLASPTQPDNPEKAPWYFVGMQEMVSYSAWSGAVLFPLALLIGLLLLPLLDRRGARTGRWFADAGWPIALIAPLVGAFVAASGLALWLGGATRVIGLDPATLVLIVGALAALLAGLGQRRWSAAGVALLALLLGAYLVFTLVGGCCRGPAWQFFWPWQPWDGGGAP